jgi:hypothetical protein
MSSYFSPSLFPLQSPTSISPQLDFNALQNSSSNNDIFDFPSITFKEDKIANGNHTVDPTVGHPGGKRSILFGANIER